jgi:hypothetical protein
MKSTQTQTYLDSPFYEVTFNSIQLLSNFLFFRFLQKHFSSFLYYKFVYKLYLKLLQTLSSYFLQLFFLALSSLSILLYYISFINFLWELDFYFHDYVQIFLVLEFYCCICPLSQAIGWLNFSWILHKTLQFRRSLGSVICWLNMQKCFGPCSHVIWKEFSPNNHQTHGTHFHYSKFSTIIFEWMVRKQQKSFIHIKLNS